MIDNTKFTFFKNKKILITGHTGFKGSWLTKILLLCGAKVCGYSLKAPTKPNLYGLSNVDASIESVIADIRDFKTLKATFESFKPEIVIHLAAQPLVRESYQNPRFTYETNVLGTLNVLECVRLCESVKSFLNVTTDKVYLNKDEENYRFKEEDPLDGYDPYSNSKSCSELITHSYQKSFFQDGRCAISTARAGNVIGGGDFSENRIIPDCIRAVTNGDPIIVRNPCSIRPYQHVLEPLFAYLTILAEQYKHVSLQGSYNIGPDDCDCITTGKLVSIFCEKWKNGATWVNKSDCGPHEAKFLKLDNSKIKNTFQWKPIWNIDKAVDKVCRWTKIFLKCPDDVPNEMECEIIDFLGDLQ